jgi:hypothetical protein
MSSARTPVKRYLLAALSVALAASAPACGNGDASFDAPDADGGSFGSPEGSAGDESVPACVDSVQTADVLPLDLVFLVDRSGSEAGPEWDSASRAMLQFLSQGFRSPTQVALTFLPYAVPEDVFGDQIGTSVDFCQYRVYENFVVPLGPVATQRSAFEKAIANAVLPSGVGFGSESPYYAALQGTYFAATKAQDAHPDHEVVVVVVGDGQPTDCPSYGSVATDPSAIAGLAASALDYDGVRTFGITFTGIGLANMNAISTAGGGVVYNAMANTPQDLLDAMNQVARSATDCTFKLPVPPAGQTLDPTRVQVEVTSSTGGRTTVPEVSEASCGQSPGWYYDNVSRPGKVIFCPSSCEALKADPIARVEVVIACSAATR